MDFRILGPLEALDEAGPVELTGGKQKALLALLLLHADQVVPVDQLVDDLWGEKAPDTARKMIQIYVSRLRKRLPAELVQTRPSGYLLRLGDAELDLHWFERLLDDGRRALAAGDAEAASEQLGAALRLWRGPALAEFDEPFAQPEGGRLEELRLVCLEERIEADLALGRHGDLVGELEALIARYPLHEGLRQQHMLALYRSGRQAEALAAYQEARHALAGELGIEPSPALRELERRILQQDASLELTPAAHALRAGLARGKTLEEAAVDALAEDTGFDIAAALGELLAEGVVVGAEPDESLRAPGSREKI